MLERDKMTSSESDLTRPTPGDLRVDGASLRPSASDDEGATRVSGSSFRSGGAVPEDSPPEIEGYEIHEMIHHGGQGIVFRATQRGAKRQVALKVILEGPYASEHARRRFEREVELAASLRHPGIVTILEAGVSGGRCYYAMEYIAGERLSDYFRNYSPNLQDSLYLLVRICDAVNYAHQHGVIHRDLKPSNILVDLEGNPHILDFGLAKAQRGSDPDASTLPALSMTGQVLGTLAYMSPEQAMGSQDVDVRSDVYSLGVIAYELLLGRTPYPVDGPLGEVLTRIANAEPKPPRQARSSSRFAREIGDELETILLKALDKDPNRRYQTAGDFSRDLVHYLRGEAIEAKRASGLYMLRKTLKRYRLHAFSAGILLFMLFTFLIIFALQYRQERQLREQAEALRTVAIDQARNAAEAEAREREARESAEHERRSALAAAEQRRRALIQQTIQRGDLALLRGDLSEARDCYWDAVTDAPDSRGAHWALRQYYLQTGDAGCSQLYLRHAGPVALSPDGALAAICDSPSAISLREISSGLTLAWMQAPSEVLTLSVSNSGLIAAAGENWARLWQIPAVQPLAVIEFQRDSRPSAAYALESGQLLLTVDETHVSLYRCTDGTLLAEQSLHGTPAGVPVLSPAQNTLAIPTTAGIEIARLENDRIGLERTMPGGSGSNRPRAARFLDEDTLALLADEIYITALNDPKKMRWRLRMQLPDNCDFFDLQDGGRTLALGSRDGRVELYQSAQLVKHWRVTPSRLEDLRLTADGAALLTLDDQGAITRWNAASPSVKSTFLSQPVAKWARSGDGGTVLLVDETGGLAAYDKNQGLRTIPFEWSSLLRRLTGGSADDVLISVDHDGQQAVVVSENRIWLIDLRNLRPAPIPWRNREGAIITHVALSDDARTLAFCARKEDEQRDTIIVRHLSELPKGESKPAIPPRRDEIACEFIGGKVTEFAFIPGTIDLLVARSYGEIHRISTADSAVPRATRRQESVARDPWTVLDAPAERIAFDRGGTLAALGCADGFVRLLDPADATEIAAINLGKSITSVSIDAAGETLLCRSSDGAVFLNDLHTLEQLAHWPGIDPGRRPLAIWFGPNDDILLAERTAIRELAPARYDRLIDDNRVYARQRRIARALTAYRYDEAWEHAAQLESDWPELAHDMRIRILSELLRRPRARLNPGWIDDVTAELDPLSALQLGHAAYEGNRIDIAFRNLCYTAERLEDRIDAHTSWRIAECLYLLDRPGESRAELLATLRRPDFNAHDLPRAYLGLLAAQALMPDLADYGDLRQLLESTPRLARAAGSAEMTTLQWIGRALFESGARPGSHGQMQAMLGYLEGLSVPYRDELVFIAGETARARGDLTLAARQYQRCIDLARGDWPANWARYRLQQLPSKE